MQSLRVSLSFASLPDADLSEFNNAVILGLTGNPHYATPAVPLVEQTAAGTKFLNAVVAAAQGGVQFTAVKDAARDALIPLLRTQASYVQTVANDDLAVILSSGFGVNSTNRTSTTLPKPSIENIDNVASSQLMLRITTIDNARAYEVRINAGNNNWQNAGVFTKSRRVVLQNLTPGTTYAIQARAVGGKTGYSDWSDPVSHMSL